MQLDDRLRHLGLPDVDLDDDAALAGTRRRIHVRRRRRLVGWCGAVVFLVGLAAVLATTAGDREAQVATVGAPKRYLPASVPDDLQLRTVDEAPTGAASTRVEDGPGALRIGYLTDPAQPRWLDLEVFPHQRLDVDDASRRWPDARKVVLDNGRPAVLRRGASVAWNLDGSVLRLDAQGLSTDALLAVAASVSAVDEREWVERTAGADIGPPYGFLQRPRTVAEGPGWRVEVGIHRPWLQRTAERLVFTDETTGAQHLLATRLFGSPMPIQIAHARSGKTVVAFGFGPTGTTSFRLTYGDEVIEVDAFVDAASGTPVFAVDVGPIQTEPTEIEALDETGSRIAGIIQPPSPLGPHLDR